MATEAELIEAELLRRELKRRGLAGTNQGQPQPGSAEAPIGLDPLGPQSVAGMRGGGTGRNTGGPLWKGIGENALSMATGLLSTPVSGLAGIGEMIPGVRNFIPGDNPAEAVERVGSALTYQPKSPKGRDIQEQVAKPFAAIEKFVDDVSFKVARGNPIAATVIKTTLLGGPSLAGVRGARAKKASVQDAVRDLERSAGELNIEFGRDVRQQLIEAGENAAVPFRGESMSAVRNELRQRYEAERQRVDQLYDDARATYADIDQAAARSLQSRLAYELDTFGLEDMPRARSVLNRVDELFMRAPDRAVTLDELERIRRSIQRTRPGRADRAQNEAMSRIRDTMDTFLDDMFNKDMIRGDQDAVAAWRTARDANQSMRARFTDNTTLRRLIEEEEVTGLQMRNWVLGSNQVGFGAEAAATINALKRAIGEDSPAFNGLRSEALYNFVSPLMGDTPNWSAFLSRYNKNLRDNWEVIDALSIESKTPINELVRIARAVEETGAAPNIQFNLNRMLAQVMFGHQIAQAGMRVNIASSMIQLLRGTGASERNKMLQNMLGYDPNVPMVPKGSPAAAAIILAEMEQSDRVLNDTLGIE